MAVMDWGPFPATDEENADAKIAAAAVAALRSAPSDRPFFIACGFRLPHVPCFAPQKWFDLYPEESLQMPAVKEDDRTDTPPFSWFLHWKLPEPRLAPLRRHAEWRPLVRAYLASVSAMDAMAGRVLEALEASGRSRETIVVFWSDHGWHLGEKHITGKNSLWERSTRVPLLLAGPGIAGRGQCDQPAELLDIFPTLVDLCGLTAPDGLAGISLRPQLTDPEAVRTRPAITSHNQGNHSVRDRHWRYIRYADGSEELYDLRRDPHEWTNLAGRPETEAKRRELASQLPQPDVPAVSGSAHRILSRIGESDRWQWEGSEIVPGSPIPGMDD
jgi:arylsulfatase A-like enzyme